MAPLLFAAAIEAAWVVAYLATLLITASPRPKRPAADPSLPPATQVMLARRARNWIPAAVDATYAGLLRRGWLDTGGNRIRLGAGDGGQLGPAEAHVQRHVGTVVSESAQQDAPLHVLSEGPGAADGWHGFGKAVIDDGKDRGLVKDRLPGAVTTLLIIGGAVAPTAFSFLAFSGDTMWAAVVCSVIFGGGLHAWLVKGTLAGQVLTRAGAAMAGPVDLPLTSSPLTAPRDNASGWIHDEQTGWRPWRLQEPPVIRFSGWPNWILVAAAVAWTAGLLSLMSTSDGLGLDDIAMPLLGVYLGAIAVRLLIGLYRALLVRRRRREFERTRTPLEGLAVRKYKDTYSVSGGDGSHERTDHVVVVAVSATGLAREFAVPERVYDTVQEGQTRVRALPGWQARESEGFEVLA